MGPRKHCVFNEALNDKKFKLCYSDFAKGKGSFKYVIRRTDEMSEKMLVTQALDERDLLVKKINDKIQKMQVVDTKKHYETKTIACTCNKTMDNE